MPSNQWENRIQMGDEIIVESQEVIEKIQARVRFLATRDLQAPVDLEHDEWSDDQAATRDELSHRIESFPNLATGIYCVATGRLPDLLVMKPAVPRFWMHAGGWRY